MADTAPPVPETPLGWGARLGGLAAFVLVVGAIVYAARHIAPPPPEELPERSALALDLSAPDALIESRSLAQLPRDLLDVPLLKDALTEDFVFYYQSNADRLGLLGSLRRIAYEHELELQDTLLQELLDQPAQIALWRGRDGKLAHALLRLQRGALAKTLQPLAQAAAEDRQLSLAGAVVVNGDAVSLYRLRYGAQRELLFASYGDALYVLTSPGMILSDDDAALGQVDSDAFAALVADRVRFAPRFGLQAGDARHRIVVRADYLALGYGRFVPQLAGVRFEMDERGWRAQLALDGGAAFDLAPLWRAMPTGPAACAAAPVSSQALQPVLEKLALPAALSAQFDGPVALCWYASSRLHTPLIVTRLSGDNPQLDAELGAAFAGLIGNMEGRRDDAARFPVANAAIAEGQRWQRVVGSDFGLHPSSDAPEKDELLNDGYFRVTLLRHGDLIAFSLDDRLVDQAQAALEKRFPPLADTLPAERAVPAYVAPKALAQLLEQETLDALPADMEAVFRNAAERHLLPKLRAAGTHPAFAVTLPATLPASGRWQWVPLEWKAL